MGGNRNIASARSKAKKMRLSDVSRTIFLCVDRDQASCASGKQMNASWKHLKSQLKAKGLAKKGGVMRLKMSCCGLCKAGPIATVMPDQVWYGQCTPDVIDRIIDEHLIEGNIVHDYVITAPESVHDMIDD